MTASLTFLMDWDRKIVLEGRKNWNVDFCKTNKFSSQNLFLLKPFCSSVIMFLSSLKVFNLSFKIWQNILQVTEISVIPLVCKGIRGSKLPLGGGCTSPSFHAVE